MRPAVLQEAESKAGESGVGEAGRELECVELPTSLC
jgi:hypothetical protein